MYCEWMTVFLVSMTSGGNWKLWKTRQKGLQSNSGPCLFVFVCWHREEAIAWNGYHHHQNIHSYIGQLLTAADRCKNLLRTIESKLGNFKMLTQHFKWSYYLGKTIIVEWGIITIFKTRYIASSTSHFVLSGCETGGHPRILSADVVQEKA